MSDQKPWEDYAAVSAAPGPENKPWEQFGGATETDGPLARGFKKAGQSIAMTSQLTGGDTAGAAQTIKEAADYAQANPSRPEGQKLMEAWDKGDGVMGGIGNVARQVKSDYDQAKGFIPGLKAVGRDLRAMGEGVVEQVPNMIAPTVGMVGGAAAGSTVGGPVGALAGGWAGASAGNALVEGGDQIQTGIQKAGIDPRDTKAVQAYLDANRDQLLKQTAIKGSVIGAVDTATAGLAHFLLTAPGKAAAGRALSELGVDVADKAAVKAATQSDAFARLIANDATYQASKKGAGNIARNVTAAGLEPAGEFAGEYVGQGLASGDWDTKNAALEALSSVGHSGAMFTGQKAYQAATKPRQGAASSQEPAARTEEGATAPLALPAPPPSTGTPSEQLAASDADRAAQVAQADARAADLYQQRDQFDAARQANQAGAPISFDRTPAEELAAQRKAAMGIDPTAGPLSAGAAIAVESQAAEEVRLGAASVLAEGAARAQQAQAERAAWEAANPGIPYEPVQPEREDSRPAPTSTPEPAGSFGAMNDFADLLSHERQDAARRRTGIVERQGQRREFDLAEADRRTAESMQREAQARRRAVLDAVLADPDTKNPAGRFAAMLRREGYRDSNPTADELKTIQRFEDVRAARPAPPEVEPSTPNELDPAALGIRERRAPAKRPQPAAESSFDPGKSWGSLSNKERANLAGRLQGVPPIITKNIHRANWGNISPALRAKLAEAMQPRAAGQAAIDAAAHEAATSPQNSRAQPTEAQAKAGNYKKGHISIGGLDVAIENPEGSTRSGTDPGGKPWSVTMGAHYGYVKRTTGADGDQVDVYIGKADPVQSPVFVVDQYDRQTGKFDEHKAILGASSLEEAQSLYDAHFSDGKGAERRGAVTPMSFDAFKDWARNGNTKAPIAARAAAPNIAAQAPSTEQTAPNITQEAQRGAIGPDSAGVAAGNPSQGSVDAGSVVDHRPGSRGRAGGSEASNDAPRAAPGVPGTGAGGAGRVKRRGGMVVTDERLPHYAESLAAMAQDAGWQEQGGRMIRDGDGNVTGRTKWLPRAEWFQAGMQADPQALAESVRKAQAGEAIPSKDQRTISAMMDYLDAQEQGRPLDGDSSAAEWERIGYNEASAQEQAAFDAIDEFLDAVPLNEVDAMRALGFTEDEIRAEIEASNRQGGAGETQAGRAQERPSDDRAGPRDEKGADLLQAYSEQDLANRAEAERQAAELRAKDDKRAEDKAHADSERNSFALTGSDRPADVLAAQGQEGLFDQPANQNPIKKPADVSLANEGETVQPAESKETAAPAESAPSPLESLFEELDSTSTRKANKARRAASKHAQADRINYVQANFHDLLIQAMEAGNLEVNGARTLTEDNKTCL